MKTMRYHDKRNITYESVGDPMFVAGNALFMKYVLQLAYNGGSLDVTVDDRMFLVTENRIINESIFSKFGIQVASVQLVIEKSP